MFFVDPFKLFDELLRHARPASVTAFNQILTVVSRALGRCSSSTSDSELVVSLFNQMIYECSVKVAPSSCTYSILIGCFCRMGRLKHDFAAFGLILKTGWRVDHIVINQVLKGLYDAKRLSEAMEFYRNFTRTGSFSLEKHRKQNFFPHLGALKFYGRERSSEVRVHKKENTV
jgi:pentatricopeptide repeat protein